MGSDASKPRTVAVPLPPPAQRAPLPSVAWRDAHASAFRAAGEPLPPELWSLVLAYGSSTPPYELAVRLPCVDQLLNSIPPVSNVHFSFEWSRYEQPPEWLTHNMALRYGRGHELVSFPEWSRPAFLSKLRYEVFHRIMWLAPAPAPAPAPAAPTPTPTSPPTPPPPPVGGGRASAAAAATAVAAVAAVAGVNNPAHAHVNTIDELLQQLLTACESAALEAHASAFDGKSPVAGPSPSPPSPPVVVFGREHLARRGMQVEYWLVPITTQHAVLMNALPSAYAGKLAIARPNHTCLRLAFSTAIV